MHDANFNMTGLIDADGDVVERFRYDPYNTRSITIEDNDALKTNFQPAGVPGTPSGYNVDVAPYVVLCHGSGEV